MNIAAFSQQETMKLKENDVCIYITESLGCRAEIITTIVNQLYLNKTWKNKKKKQRDVTDCALDTWQEWKMGFKL